MNLQIKILEWLKSTGSWLITMLGLIALWGATGAAVWSAVEAKRTADTIDKMEKDRLDYEKNKYTSEIFARYADFIAKNRPILACFRALNELDENSELKAVLDEPSEFDFQIKNQKHLAILECL